MQKKQHKHYSIETMEYILDINDSVTHLQVLQISMKILLQMDSDIRTRHLLVRNKKQKCNPDFLKGIVITLLEVSC